MTTVTDNEISQARSVLSDEPNTTAALQVIEECEGNLEDAFEVLLIESGVEVERSRLGSNVSLEQLAQRCRDAICQKDFQAEFVDEFSRELLKILVSVVTAHLAIIGNLPAALAVPVSMYVLKQGIKRFCKSVDFES